MASHKTRRQKSWPTAHIAQIAAWFQLRLLIITHQACQFPFLYLSFPICKERFTTECILTNDSQVLDVKYTAMKIFKKVRFNFFSPVKWSQFTLWSLKFAKICKKTYENIGKNQAMKQERRRKKTGTSKPALNNNKGFFPVHSFFFLFC